MRNNSAKDHPYEVEVLRLLDQRIPDVITDLRSHPDINKKMESAIAAMLMAAELKSQGEQMRPASDGLVSDFGGHCAASVIVFYLPNFLKALTFGMPDDLRAALLPAAQRAVYEVTGQNIDISPAAPRRFKTQWPILARY